MNLHLLIQHHERPDEARYTRVGHSDRDEQDSAGSREIEEYEGEQELPERSHSRHQSGQSASKIAQSEASKLAQPAGYSLDDATEHQRRNHSQRDNIEQDLPNG